MKKQHTPGPWTLVETPHEKIISSWHVQIGEHQISVHPYKRIWSEDRSQSGLVADEQHMADARLIAAAPDLLDALRCLLTACTDDGQEKFSGHYAAYLESVAKPRARDAIAKALGEK